MMAGEPISTQSSSAHVEERDQELSGTLEQDCLGLVSAKNNKGVSDWSIQVSTREGFSLGILK